MNSTELSAAEPPRAKSPFSDNADGTSSQTEGRVEFEQFEAEIPTFIENKKISYQSQDKFIWSMRMNFYICFFVYMILANVILFCGRWNLKNETLVDQILGLKISERRIEQMFLYNGLMLATAALLGVYSIMNNKYSLFLIDLVIDSQLKSVSKMFDEKISTYDWFNITSSKNREINTFQLTFKCCGSTHGYEDWEKMRPQNSTMISTGTFPWTCCPQVLEDILHAKHKYCGFQDVEKRLNCPAAFKQYLVHLRNNLSAQATIMFQVILIEALTVGLFAYKMIRTQKMIRYHPTPENIYSLSGE